MAAAGLANKNELVGALQGAERQTLELIAEVSTFDEWAELLQAPLKRAVARGNRDLAQKLVEAGAGFGDALHEAAGGGHGGIANDLLEKEAEIETEDEHGRTPLHCAAFKGQTEMVQLLLLKGADKDALTADSQKLPPLFLAIESNNVATARALLAGGADVNVTDCLGFTALHVVPNSEAIDVLMEAGASIEARDKYDATPLHYAAEELNPVAVTALLRHGADLNARGVLGDTPLHRALRGAGCDKTAEVVDILLRSGADVNAQEDEHGDTPLHIAARKVGLQGAAGLVDLLLRSGADETITNEHDEDTMDVVGIGVAEEDRVGEDVNRVKGLLMDAPADRAWRRRGYLVLCRAHPDRVQLGQESSSQHGDAARRTRGETMLARVEAGGCGEAVGGNLVGEKTGGDWAGVVRKVLGLQEEGIFRTIVGYL